MSKVKHVANASALINDAFAKMPEHIQLMVNKLRALVHEAEPQIIEDWKWGPNFYCNGMVCNVWGFKKHASIVFFNGVNMQDKFGLFNAGEANSKMRTIKFNHVDEIDSKQIVAYVKEAVKLNKTGDTKADKAIEIPTELKSILTKHKLLAVFNKQNFTFKKEAVQAFTSAKQVATQQRSVQKLIEQLQSL
jgi:hypothetical protein